MNIAADINTEKLYSAIEGETPFTDGDLVQFLPDLAETVSQNGVFQDGALGVGMYTDSTDMYQKEGSCSDDPEWFLVTWCLYGQR